MREGKGRKEREEMEEKGKGERDEERKALLSFPGGGQPCLSG